MRSSTVTTQDAPSSVYRLERQQVVPGAPEDVFVFFSDPYNLERITPSWLRFQVLTAPTGEMSSGDLIDYRLRLHGLPLRWTSRIESWKPGRVFVDR